MRAKIMQVAVTPTRSGTEQMILDLTERLVADGATVTVVVPTGSEELDRMEQEAQERGASVERVSPLYPGDRNHSKSLRDLYSLFMRQQPTIVHYHIPRALSGFEAILAGYLARVRGRIRTDHNPVVHPPTQLQLLRLRIADRMVHRIVLVSTDNLKSHLDVCGRPIQKCLVVPNGIDVRTVSHDQSPIHRTLLRDRLGLPVGVPVAVMVATLGERKGALDYIKAAHVASRIHSGLHFAVIGDGEMMSTMRRMATEFRIGDRVHFLGRRADVRSVLPAFDVFVLPSHYEGLAITMLEALAAGLPMVTTRVDGVSDVLPREQGALFVDKYDIDGLGAAMAQLAGDPELGRQLAAISAERVLSGFTAEMAYERYRTLYSQLCTIN